MDPLRELQDWYQSHCDGDWEHQFGVAITSLDNPGWMVTVDLEKTGLAGKPFTEVNDLNSGRDWIHCRVEGAKFLGACGPFKLEQALRVFLDWANTKGEANAET